MIRLLDVATCIDGVIVEHGVMPDVIFGAEVPVGFQSSVIGPDLDFYAARSYSLTRPPRTGGRWIRFRERSATG